MKRSTTDMNCRRYAVMFVHWNPGRWRWECWDRGKRIYTGIKNNPTLWEAIDDFTDWSREKERAFKAKYGD